MLYSQDTCLYPLLNKALRDHSDVEGVKAFLPYLKLLLTGLNKLPLIRAKVFRGIRTDVHDVYNQLEHKDFTWWALSSTTTRKAQAHTFLHRTEGTLFTIDAIGVDISACSSYPDEQEVLLLPGTRLIVESGVKAESGYWTYNASVWQAAKQRLPQYQNASSDANSPMENGVEKSPGVTPMSENHNRMSMFQNTDLPHPGWESILTSEEKSR